MVAAFSCVPSFSGIFHTCVYNWHWFRARRLPKKQTMTRVPCSFSKSCKYCELPLLCHRSLSCKISYRCSNDLPTPLKYSQGCLCYLTCQKTSKKPTRIYSSCKASALSGRHVSCLSAPRDHRPSLHKLRFALKWLYSFLSIIFVTVSSDSFSIRALIFLYLSTLPITSFSIERGMYICRIVPSPLITRYSVRCFKPRLQRQLSLPQVSIRVFNVPLANSPPLIN